MKTILFVALPSEFPSHNAPANVEVIYTGVGKVNAAIKATEVLKDLIPSETVVLNYGSAGAHEAMFGQLFKCKTFVQSDIDVRPFAEKTITPFDGLIYPQLSNSDGNSDVITFGEGLTCCTQDTFQKKPMQICEMEAYSIAKVCKIYGFDFTAYKFISDDGKHDDWNNNHMKGIDMFSELLKTL